MGLLPFIFLSLAFADASDNRNFWVINDWHINNWFDADASARVNASEASVLQLCEVHTDVAALRPGLYGSFGCDANLALWEEALAHMAGQTPAPDFILWLGDNYGHTTPPDTEEKTLRATQLLATMLYTRFPNATVVPAVGNHDTYPYNSDANSAYYAKLCRFWAPWLDERANATCSQAGYFSILVAPGLRALSLNTQHQTAEMLDWSAQVLKESAAAGEKVFVVKHIPMGPASCYNCTASNGYEGDIWNADFQAKFTSLLDSYAEHTITAMFSAHTHNDEFRVYHNVPIYITPSLTPYNPNTNPEIRLLRVNDAGIVVDYQQHYMDLDASNREKVPRWYTYDPKQMYGLRDLSAESWIDFAHRMDQNDDLFQSYAAAFNGFPALPSKCDNSWSSSVYNPKGGGGRCKSALICRLLNPDDASYFSCLAAHNETNTWLVVV